MSTTRQLFLGNVSYQATIVDIRDTFAALGICIGAVRIGTEQDTGRSRGFAFVDLDPAETRSIDELVSLASGALIRDRPCRVDIANQHPSRPERSHVAPSASLFRRKRSGGGGGRGSGGGFNEVWDD